MKTKILAVILAVAMLVSMLPMYGAVSANAYFSSDEFENLDMWEDMAANYRMSTAPSISTASSVTTYDGKTVLKPAISQSRASGMTTIKAANFPTDKRIETITTKFRLPLENAMTAGQINPDSSPGVYLLRINNYSGLAFQVTNYYNKNNAADTKNGTLVYQWIDVYYSEGAMQNKNVVDCANGVSRKNTTTTADQWITATFTYDYSQIAENKLTVDAVLTPADGSTPITTSYTKEFEAEGNNAYSDGFQIGIVAAASANIAAYFDSYAVEFEKTAADLAADFRTNNDYALDLPEINSSYDFEKVEAAIAEYETLSEDVKDLLSTEIAKLNFLMNDFDATCFKEEYAQVLELETVATNAQASSVLAAIAAYAELDDAVKDLLNEQITKLNELKATIKITEFDFEDEALFNEVWESLPETGDIQTGNNIATSTQKAPATIVADSLDENNSVLFPEIRNTSRKRKILTVKENYLNEGKISSLSTDLRIDGSAENWDSTAGVYLYYKNPYNYARFEFWHQAETDLVKTRVMFGSGSSDSDLTTTSLVNNANAEGFGEKEWVTVKADYTYTEEGTDVTLTITEKATNTVLLTKEFSVDFDMSNGKVGYASASSANWLTYFDNFALTYETPVVEPEEPEAPVVQGATIKRSGTQDIMFNYAIDASEEKKVVEYGMLLTLNDLNAGELSLDNTASIDAGLIHVGKVENVEITEATSFNASIGAVPMNLYTHRYSTRVYVKYADGEIVYSDVVERSVAGVAKNIAGYVFANKDNAALASLAEEVATLVESVDGETVTLTEAGKADNGKAVLKFLQLNSETISNAINVIGQ